MINQSLVEKRAPLPCGESCLVVYDSVSYGMVDNLGRSDEWLGIYWLGSGEVRWASGG